MEVRNLANPVADETLACVFAHLDSPVDLSAVSRVCRQWRRVDSNTRKHVQIANCYSVAPATLTRRFPRLLSLKLKGKSRAFEFELLPPNWGGYAGPWLAEVARAYAHQFQSLWLRRMVVTDDDLLLLATSCHDSLVSLKLDKCSGFSARGLEYITVRCRLLKVLYLEESSIQEGERSREWLHELAVNNPNIEELNFQYTTGLDDIDVDDLDLIAANCRSLRSLKVAEVDVLDMERVANKCTALVELGTGDCSRVGDPEVPVPIVNFPRTIMALSGFLALNDLGVPAIVGMLANLKKLDLQFSLLSQDGYCQILQHCTSLEVLMARNGLGDAGLITVARTCKNLRRIRIDDSEGESILSPAGIIPLAKSCVRLEYVCMYVHNISNATLVAFGRNSVLKDCRFVLLSALKVIPDLPLDEGVKALLRGCRSLTRFALYVRNGALTDRGMGYIGEYGGRLKWILLGCTGESDLGFTRLAAGCHSLERLEIRDCPFTELGCVTAATAMPNLKFMWVQGREVTEAGGRMLAGARSHWIVEIAPTLQLATAYVSLAEPRIDNPAVITVIQGGNHQINHGKGGAV
ncbi:unnamed protein product [Calypogeia fissa]